MNKVKDVIKIGNCTIGIETVTPAMALKWLANGVHNRKIREINVERLTKSMLENKWKFIGDTIRFNEEDDLLDGQHRLKALIASKKTLDFLVIRNLPTSCMDVIDTGKARSLADVLRLEYPDLKYTCCLSSALKRLHPYKQGKCLSVGSTSAATNVSNQEGLELYKNNRKMEESNNYVCNNVGLKQLMPLSMASFFHYILHEIDGDAAEVFFDRLSSGLDLCEGSPILVLRNRIFTDKVRERSKRVLNDLVLTALITKAWNFFLKGKQIKTLSYSSWKEKFPMIQKTIE